MNIDPNESPTEADLNWLAEQYVLGELDESAGEAFETRLASDQSAREAVACAAALLAATLAAGSALPDVRSLAISRTNKLALRTAWFSGIAAALALTAFLVWQSNSLTSESNSQLARTWSETRENIDEAPEEESLLVAEAFGSHMDDNDVPDWLVTAVSLHQGNSSDGERSPVKPDAGEGA
jgi:anti-sigma-K factor RskA